MSSSTQPFVAGSIFWSVKNDTKIKIWAHLEGNSTRKIITKVVKQPVFFLDWIRIFFWIFQRLFWLGVNEFRNMASDPKFAEDFSPSVKISDVNSSIKDLYFGKGLVIINEKFLDELKNWRAKQHLVHNLPLPNEILTKIFSFLDIQKKNCRAQVSQQFNNISELTWKSWAKITFQDKEVTSEFLYPYLSSWEKNWKFFDAKCCHQGPTQFGEKKFARI